MFKGSNLRNLILLALFGAISGYLYYYFVGCVTGTCAITSNPVISTLYGAVLGVLISGIFAKKEPTAFLPWKSKKKVAVSIDADTK